MESNKRKSGIIIFLNSNVTKKLILFIEIEAVQKRVKVAVQNMKDLLEKFDKLEKHSNKEYN